LARLFLVPSVIVHSHAVYTYIVLAKCYRLSSQ